MSDHEYGEIVIFSGSCTCSHDRDEHGWGSCGVLLEDGITECPCEAGWEE